MRYTEILEACWTGYQQQGMKKKGDRMVPNCVPVSEQEMEEDLKKWFKEKWVRFGPDGKIRGDCARGSSKEGKPKCLPQSKAHALGKKGRASAAAKKRREDPNPERRGAARNVATKVKEALGLYGPFTVTINTGERPQSRTKTKKFKREDDAILWAEDWLEDFSQYSFATAQVTDPDGNVVWATDESLEEQGVAESSVDNNAKLSWVAKKLASETVIPGDRKDFLKAAKRFDRGYTTGGMDIIYDMDTDPRDDFFNYCDHYGAVYEQGVAEGNNDDWYDDADEFGMPGSEFFPDEDDRLRDGDYVRDRQDGEYGEIFRMSGDPSERRVRILDRDGKGWYISPERLVVVDRTDPDIMRYFGRRRQRDMDESAVAEGFEYGSRVQHPKYGAGQVIRVYSNGTITVNFPNYPDPIDKKPGVQSNFAPGDSGYQLLKPMVSEKQDACYRKVKSRYKVWPSAYASGALVQCRKKGAANWGNKTKK